VSVTGDWDPWIQFFVRGISASARDTTQRVNDLLGARQRHIEIAKAQGLRGAARDIVDLLIGYPIFTVTQLATMMSTSFPTANNAVAKLVHARILEEVGGNPRRFVARDMVKALW